MSIEDINYLKKNSIKQSYTFLIDSTDRNRNKYINPNYYSIEFATPFKNVIGFEVIDASIPRTMYNIDYLNNKIYYYIADTDDKYIIEGFTDIVKDIDDNDIPYTDLFKMIEIPPGDYTFQNFITTINKILSATGDDLIVKSYTTPPEQSNLIEFISFTRAFVLDMERSTVYNILGFDLLINSDENLKEEKDKRYTYIDNYKTDNIEISNYKRMFHSIYNISTRTHHIISPGIVYFMGYKYIVLRCPEIEEHLYRSLSYSKYNMGLAKFRINSFGFNDEKVVITKIPLREFHPIGKLSKLTFKFEVDNGQLYDFKGINHNIVFAVYYYEPIQKDIFKASILNPLYNMNFIDYKYNIDEDESDEEDAELSRDNIDIYKKRELEYAKDKEEEDNRYNEDEDDDEEDNIDNGNEDEDNDEDDDEDEYDNEK